MVQPENTNPNQNPQLPSLEALSDPEYFERSRVFGEQWVAFVDGSSEVQTPPEGITGVVETLDKRAAAFAAISVDERPSFLVEQYRTISNDVRAKDNLPALQTEVLTPALLQQAGARVVEARHGVPALLTNERYNTELLGTKSSNFATNTLATTEGALPFVVLHDTEATHPKELELNRGHETAHTLWAIARRQEGMPQTGVATTEERAFLRIQDEGIAFATAGQRQLRHTQIVSGLRRANMNEMIGAYEKMSAQFHEIALKVEPSVVVLGMMQARNLTELGQHIDRLHTITAMMPERHRPLPDIAHSVGVVASDGWGQASSS